MKLPSFNSIANIVSIVSGVSLAGIIGVGSYVYLNKDAIIDDIKDAAVESVAVSYTHLTLPTKA